MPNCPECVFREKKTLKKEFQIEAEKAEEDGKDYLIPSDRDIEADIEFPMKIGFLQLNILSARDVGCMQLGNKFLIYVNDLTEEK